MVLLPHWAMRLPTVPATNSSREKWRALIIIAGMPAGFWRSKLAESKESWTWDVERADSVLRWHRPPVLRPMQVVGIDANSLAVQAAQVRATGYDLPSTRVSFSACSARERLPFEDDSFDLTVCSSVLEFVTSKRARAESIMELGRVTRPRGHVFISTPNPLRLREYHSRKFLGDYFHRSGYPWANCPWEFSRMFSGWQEIPVTNYHRRKLAERLGGSSAHSRERDKSNFMARTLAE